MDMEDDEKQAALYYEREHHCQNCLLKVLDAADSGPEVDALATDILSLMGKRYDWYVCVFWDTTDNAIIISHADLDMNVRVRIECGTA